MFWEILNHARMQKGLSWAKVAKESNVPYITLITSKNKNSSLSFITTCKLARTLDVDLNVLSNKIVS